MTWDVFGTASRALAQMVADDEYEPDMVLAIARGGLLIGGAIGYALSVKNVYTMNVEFYTGVDERLEVPRILPPAPDFVDVSHARDPHRRRRRRHRTHPAFGPGVRRGQGGRRAHRGPLREVALASSSATTSGSAPICGSTSRGATRIRSPSATGRSRTPEHSPIRRSRRSETPGSAPVRGAPAGAWGARCRAACRRSTR